MQLMQLLLRLDRTRSQNGTRLSSLHVAHICNLMFALMLRNYHFDYFVCFQVDGDGRNLLTGGQDSLAAAAAAQAALLSAANVGSGYTGFV